MQKFTILGLLGPAGSGKDLVADFFIKKGFAKVAYADPMKRFVQKLFGFTEAQLWGPSKERNKTVDIDDAWWFGAIGKMPIAVDELINKVMKEGVRTDGYMKLMDWFSWLRRVHPAQVSARVVLQTLGTEWGRTVDPLMWIHYGHLVVAELERGGHSYTREEGLHFHGWEDGIDVRHPITGAIIQDHRFINEVETTQKRGGYVIRLCRLAQEEKTVGIAGHQSEAEQKGMPDETFDLILEVEDFATEEKNGETVLTAQAREDFERSLEALYKEGLWTARQRGIKGARYRISPTVAGRGGALPSL